VKTPRQTNEDDMREAVLRARVDTMITALNMVADNLVANKDRVPNSVVTDALMLRDLAHSMLTDNKKPGIRLS
jgi:hypothetical protein